MAEMPRLATKNIRWSNDELDVVRSVYPREGPAGVARILTNRTKTTIMTRAHILGVVAKSIWTKEEDEILCSVFPAKGSNAVVRLLTGRTRLSVNNRACKLGVYRQEEDPLVAGTRIGHIVARSKTSAPRDTWICDCDCGGEVEVDGARMKAYRSRSSSLSCGCAENGLAVPRPYRQSTREGAARQMMSRYMEAARTHHRSFELSFEEFDELISHSCTYCGSPPSNWMGGVVKYRYSGIDRKDNAVGYLPSNCLSCCKICNVAKGARTYEEFTAWIIRVAGFNNTISRPSDISG